MRHLTEGGYSVGGYSVVIVTMLCIISGAVTALFAGSQVHSPVLLVHVWGIS